MNSTRRADKHTEERGNDGSDTFSNFASVWGTCKEPRSPATHHLTITTRLELCNQSKTLNGSSLGKTLVIAALG